MALKHLAAILANMQALCIFSQDVLQADRLWENLTKAILEKRIEKEYTLFPRILDLHDLLQDKDCGLTCRMKVSAYCTYEINFDDSGPRTTTEYFSAFFEKLGLEVYEDHGKKFWYFKTCDKVIFKNMLDKICVAFASDYSLAKPTGISSGMTFNYQAYLMQKKFGYTSDGIKKMNNWINTNQPVHEPHGKKIVNY